MIPGETTMFDRSLRMACVMIAGALVARGASPASAADLEIDTMVKSRPAGTGVTNGGGLANQRLLNAEADRHRQVKQLKGAWMTRLKGSGMGGKVLCRGYTRW